MKLHARPVRCNRSILFSILAVHLLLPVIAIAQSPTKRVLVIASYDLNRPAVNVFMQAMRSTITAGSKERVEFFYEFQENTRIPTDKYEAAMVSYMKRKYEGEKFDLAITLGAPAVKILLNHEAEIFTGTPKIFYFHDETEETVRSLWPRATGVWAHLDISKTVDLALELQPETNRVVVVSGSSAQDRFLRDQAQTELRRFQGRLEVTYVNDLSMAELKNRLASLPPNTVILYLSFFLDSAGNSYSGPEALSLFAPTANAPTYGISETYMGAGIVGGSLINFEALGHRTGETALRVLAGEQVSNIPPESVPNFQIFDWRQLKRWAIDQRRVPAAGTVRFKTPTFWELYKWYVLALIAVLIIESSLIAWLLLMRRRRRQAEATAEKAHRRLEGLISDIPGIVWETLVDPVTRQRRLTFISDYTQKMLGYTSQEWLATPGFGIKIVADEDRERVTMDAEAVLTSGHEGITEFRWRTKDGEIRWAETHLNPMTDGNAGIIGLRGVTLDITQRKASDERFRKAFRSNPQPMSLTTIDEGRYLDVNDSFLAMSGYTRDEVIGHTSLELEIWDTSASRVDFVEQLKEHGSIVNAETRFRSKDGSIRLLLSSAEQLEIAGEHCLLVASTDITERKKAEEALVESRSRLLLAQQAARFGTFDWNIKTGVNTWSAELESMYGIKPGSFAGSQSAWEDLVHQDDREKAIASVRRALGSGIPVEDEWRVQWPDGSIHWLFARFQVLTDDSGTPSHLTGINIDITSRKLMEGALREANEQLRKLKDQLEAENIYLQEELKGDPAFGYIVGQSNAIKEVLHNINVVAPTEATVLITGETGTGKELVARAVHAASSRRDRPLIRVNCGALPASLIETELFGHEKGAFTGAGSQRVGRFELAKGGTIFLDEIGELALESQVKLLRVLQEGEFERVGGTKTIRVDVRIIAATNRNLKAAVDNGTFREDLWYRLNVFPIAVPPLRQRREDIPLLTEHFVREFSLRFGKDITGIAPATVKALREYSWRGNVRELANVLERAVINTNGSVLRLRERLELVEPVESETKRSSTTLTEVERDYIVGLLESCGWRVEGPHGAARVLGLHPSTLRSKMSKLGIRRMPNNDGTG